MSETVETPTAEKKPRDKKPLKIILGVIIGIVVLCIAAVIAFVCLSSVKADLNGDAEITLTNGEQYEEQGVYGEFQPPFGMEPLVMANIDVVIDGEVDDTTPGDYVLTYEIDYFGWSDTVTRTVHVVDTAAPTITLTGATTIYLMSGESFDEPGYEATDDYDGDVTDKVEVAQGGGKVTYTVSDSSGNTATAERIITYSIPQHKVVYLTFDDGPSQYTQQLLDVLAAHHVRATFFVTAYGDSSMIAREAAAGHTIGVHTATHDFNTVYASEDAYLADFERMESIIQQQTGKRTTLFRFPGGSSNTASSFNPGIMTRLTALMVGKGYQYFDWNVSSGDAGGTTSTDEVYQNVIDGIASHDVSVVLQHDSKGYSVAAVDRILTWGEQNGYVFLPLQMDSYPAHHPISN